MQDPATYPLRCIANCRARLGESVLWHEERGTLMWLDLLEPRLFELDLDGGEPAVTPIAIEPPLGSMVRTTSSDHMILAHRGGLGLLEIATGKVTPWAAPEGLRDGIGLNDGKVDRHGRLWVGSFDLAEREPRGILWRLSASAEGSIGDAGFIVSNGPAFSPDGATLYFNDSCARRTLAYDVVDDARVLANRRSLITYDDEEGLPDGITVDADGNLWVAHWAGSRISRIKPDGERSGAWSLPTTNVTSLCFGGRDHATLFVTTATEGCDPDDRMAGNVFAFEFGIRGLPEAMISIFV